MMHTVAVPITWRPAALEDIEACLAIPPADRGGCASCIQEILAFWLLIFKQPFFFSCVIESDPPIGSHRLIGFGFAVFVHSDFVDAELANPHPDITSRIMESIHSTRSALAT